MTIHRPIKIIFLAALISFIISSCSDFPLTLNRGQDQGSQFASAQEDSGAFVAFEGHVFVASTRPENNFWQTAGWKISSQPVAGDEKSVPADCTLYPHQGVDDQWIGSCSGNIHIPRAGANHIAVMHTQADGTTRMVQVAPPPVASEP